MELRKIEGLYKPEWPRQPLDAWSGALKSVCGNFNPMPARGCSTVQGVVEATQAGGVEFAHVAMDIDCVERTWLDIARDDNEYLFLIVQLTGSAMIEQHGRRTVLQPGDCILIDSARPSTFVLDGLFTNQLSVHLPRQLMVSGSSMKFSVASRLDRADPMATSICSLIAKMLMLKAAGQSKVYLGSLLFDTVRFAFEFDDRADLLPRLAGRHERVEMVEDLIDRELTDPGLTPAGIAASLGQPLRRIQEDFQAAGLTLSSVIREKRLKLAAQKLRGESERGSRINIAQIALTCGFNDISYFNRSFRDYHGLTPSELARSDWPVTRRVFVQ